MGQEAFFWTILSTLLGGIQLFFQKVVAEEKRPSALNGLFMYSLSGIAAFVILFTFYKLPSAWMLIAAFGLGAGALHGLGNFIRLEALGYIDSVIYFPINKVLGPLLVVFGGVMFYAEQLTAREYIGIALSLTVPLLLISAAEHHRQKDLRRGLIFVVLSTFFTSASVLLTKQGIIYDNDLFFIMGMSQIAGAISSGAILLKQRGATSSAVFHITKRDIELGLIAGVLGFFSWFTLLKALSLGLISLVYVIHAHYILIPIILSVWWYKDHINFRKAIAVVVSFLAITILYSP